MQDKGSRIGGWGRLLSVVGVVLLAVAYLGPSAALAAPDQAPAITSADEAYFHVGVPASFTVTTSGSPAPAISTPDALPTGLTFLDKGNGTATISGTAASGQEGDHPITITAANGVGPAAVQSFTIEVGAVCPVVITSANSTNFVEGEAGTFQTTATSICAITWTESGALPSGVTFNTSGLLAGTPGPGTAGAWPFTITATCATCTAATQGFTLTVGPPLLVTSTVFTATEDQSFSGNVASFSGGSAASSATVDWGDGTTDAGTIAGTDVSGTHTYAEEGSKSVTVSVTDTGGVTASSTLAETVNDAGLINCDCTPPAIAANEGAVFSGVIGSFADNDSNGVPSDYTVTIAWGDGQTSSGTVTANEGPFTVSGTHIYEEHGPYTGGILIADAGGATTTETFTAVIAEVGPLVVTGDNITATAGVSFTGKVGSFNDPGSKEATSDYVVTINWGDGTTTAATLIDPPGILLVDGTHTYAAVGTYTFTISASETDGVFALGSGTAVVGALPLTSAPERPLPIGFLLIAATGILLAGGSVVASRRRTAAR